ncbi:acyltransferase family protein [Loktanella sp. S4079]|uniref:acyltransferase family protein n=1 Tax=Loktanella sp. S4079 TaxID=579483 RepID=UPI000AE634A8|nr:acyltransferase family protein [Loktanella sp. S4079]
MTNYRRDIDGLRAVAVLPVVLFHAHVGGMSGGYVGVDIFFVISGFLITSIIAREIAAGEFSILRFYERRARRILPALFAVIAATLIASYVFFMPTEFVEAAKSAIATVLFVSNFLFWSETGYFSPGIYSQPLLHTWSLAIEEQFYIFFPPLMMLLAWVGWRARRVIVVLTVISFLLSAVTTAMRPEMAYYLLPWRAWELGLGALIALWISDIRLSRPIREVLSIAGLIAIAVAVLGFDEATVFPGYAALLPVVGAGALLICGAQGDTLAARLLSLRPVVWIGLISYSLYLWHWPVIVFYQQLTFDRPDFWGCVIVVGLSIGLAWLSWRYIEAPFRKAPASGHLAAAGRGFAQRTIFGMSLAGMAVVIMAAGAVVVGQGWSWRLSPEAARLAAFTDDRHPQLRNCTARYDGWRSPSDPCIFGPGDGPPTVAIWGDSHAAAMLPEVEAAAHRANLRVAYLSRSGCLPVRNVDRLDGRTGRCAEYGNGAMDYLLQTPSLTTVIVVARYAMAADGYLTDYGLAERDFGPTIFEDLDTGRWPEDARLGALMEKLDETVSGLTDAGLQVAVIYPIPEIGHKVPETLAKLSLQGRSVGDFGLARSAYNARNQGVIAGLDEITARNGAVRIRPEQQLCDEKLCRTYLNGDALYYDDDHLSSVGAALLGKELDQVMQAAPLAVQSQLSDGRL